MKARFSFEQVKKHAFMAGIDFDFLEQKKIAPPPVRKASSAFDTAFVDAVFTAEKISLDDDDVAPTNNNNTFQSFSYESNSSAVKGSMNPNFEFRSSC